MSLELAIVFRMLRCVIWNIFTFSECLYPVLDQLVSHVNRAWVILPLCCSHVNYLKLTAFISQMVCLFVCLLTGCTTVFRKSWSMCCDCKTLNYFLWEDDILVHRLRGLLFPQANYQCTNKHQAQDIYHSKVFGLKLTWTCCSHGPIWSTF